MNPTILHVGLAAVLACLVAGTASAADPQTRPTGGQDWRRVLERRLPVFGHRNWIVIADSAYPSQSRAGIETVIADEDQIEVVKAVLARLEKSRHVRPNVLLDAELAYVPETDAPGIDRYRVRLKSLLGRHKEELLPHEQIIAKLDRAAEQFNVLIIKTNLTLPYTSVFLELDCGYWDAAREKRLRQAVEKATKE